jgi:hypothetical protein
MAQEPGGGTGEPYSRFEDLNYTPGYSVQDWLRNLMQQGNVGVAQPMGTNIRDFEQDPMYGRDQPSDLKLRVEHPQEFIRQQLAGDVVRMPMQPYMSEEALDARARLENNPYMPGYRGQRSIENFGGPKSPYLDLLNVLAYPRGGQIR